MTDFLKVHIPQELVDRVVSNTPDMKNEKQSVAVRTALKRYCEAREENKI